MAWIMELFKIEYSNAATHIKAVWEKAWRVNQLENIIVVSLFSLAVFPTKTLGQKEQKKRKSQGKDTGISHQHSRRIDA